MAGNYNRRPTEDIARRGQPMKKVYPDAAAALKGLLRDNMTIAAGGFGLCGIPENFIQALVGSGVKGLTIVGNNAGVDDFGMGLLLKSRQVKKVIASYVGENKEFERQVLAGELDLQLTPQGTLAEKLRAGGAGIPAFYTRTAAGTKLAEGKETKVFDGREYVLEEGIRADLSIVKAWKGDKAGNLVYRMTSRNFNPMIATCGNLSVAEVEELVEVGELDPDQIHTPGIHVDLSILGGLEVAQNGDLANWMVPGKMVKGPGGAMDLVSGVKRVVVLMEHTSRDGSSKILKQCTLPITGKGVVNMIITDLCVFEVVPGQGLVLKELHPGVKLEDVRAKTACEFRVALGS